MFWLITAVCRNTIRSHINNDKKCYPALAAILALKGTHFCPCPACLGARLAERAGAAPENDRHGGSRSARKHKGDNQLLSRAIITKTIVRALQTATYHKSGNPLHTTHERQAPAQHTMGKPLLSTRSTIFKRHERQAATQHTRCKQLHNKRAAPAA
jgi:hypothetical protein